MIIANENTKYQLKQIITEIIYILNTELKQRTHYENDRISISHIPIINIFRGQRIGINSIDYHIYADDTQLYITFDLSDPTIAIDKINLCISDLRTWMIKHKLKINDSKTEFMVLTSSFLKQQFNDLQIKVGNSQIEPSPTARNLGVIFDSHLNLESHINSVCRSAYFHLKNIRTVRNMLTDDAYSQLIHALVTVRIDYCNSLLCGLPDQSLNKLQRILNTAARIFCRIPKFGHISESLVDLHWLPVQQRVLFKVLILTYQA